MTVRYVDEATSETWTSRPQAHPFSGTDATALEKARRILIAAWRTAAAAEIEQLVKERGVQHGPGGVL